MVASGQDHPTSADKPVELEIRSPIDSAVLPTLRTVVTALARQVGFDDEQTDQIEMAVDEACANVINHAYKHLRVAPDAGGPAGKSAADCSLWLRLHLGSDYLRVFVIDRGIGLPEAPRCHDSVEEFARDGGRGGLGIFIIRNFMDEVDYESPPEAGTVLTMTKYLKSVSRARP